MKIEIWSDIMCPFCYLGKRHLELALEKLPEIEEVNIIYRSYELSPKMGTYKGGHIADELAEKYGTSVELAKQQLQGIVHSGKAVGLDYNFDILKSTNTFDAHRLTKYAKAYEKEKEMLDRLYQAFFNEGRLVSDMDTLVELGESVGLDGQGIRDMLVDQEAYALEVREDEAQASQYGIDVVPFFVINDRFAFSGAVSVEDMEETLGRIHEGRVEN